MSFSEEKIGLFGHSRYMRVWCEQDGRETRV